ncbi:M20 family metallopeptidase [Sulfoacidibacillus thermotolerans]|uniref:Peptidase M20 dimerisation domain-containing protein n=1 Tax=Sulfoacidibacillus thermotolerans TaxID=1765684 RepID=A0A2U3DB95_SULT2|nr:M20 family metallopeptidase [Sulfoacidibacillus thermotolerans]PWI58561.1 hypothetical protein BM613_03345 [Sulfoacidibacillus thermotolerans]
MTDILPYLLERAKDMENSLIQLIKAESPSTDKRLVDECGQVLASEYSRLVNGQIERINQLETGDCYRFTYGEGTEQILILGHFDTVWAQGALPIEKRAGKLYGPGAFDMKGGLVVTLFAIHALFANQVKGNRKIVFLATSDEEIGSRTSRALIETEARKSVCVLVPESSLPPNGDIKTARKGIADFTITVQGIPAHAGHDPKAGANAIEELALQIVDLRALNDHANGISLNVGRITGGTRVNVKAEFAQAEVDLRFMTKKQGEQIIKQIMHRTPYIAGTKITVTGGVNRYPLERTEQGVQLFWQFQKIAQKHGYSLQEGLSGGGSDGNFTAALGIPTIDGLGPVGDGAHARNEHVELANLPYRAALIAEFLAQNLHT